MSSRTTRSEAKRIRVADGTEENYNKKEKHMTIGQHLAEERENQRDEILQNDKMSYLIIIIKIWFLKI